MVAFAADVTNEVSVFLTHVVGGFVLVTLRGKCFKVPDRGAWAIATLFPRAGTVSD